MCYNLDIALCFHFFYYIFVWKLHPHIHHHQCRFSIWRSRHRRRLFPLKHYQFVFIDSKYISTYNSINFVLFISSLWSTFVIVDRLPSSDNIIINIILYQLKRKKIFDHINRIKINEQQQQKNHSKPKHESKK